MKYNYRFTVFTPCYNSERFIHRVYDSLKAQTFKDFEWLVVDDASTDNTLKILEGFKNEGKVNMQIVVNEINQMITKNFNIAYSMADSELFVALGHDDSIYENTLFKFNEIWQKYKADNISNICSMVKDQHGNLIGKPFNKDILIDNYFNVFLENIYTKEKYNCTRTDILKNFLYEDNGMRYIAEGDLWGNLGLQFDTIFTNEVFRTYYIEEENLGALTKRSRKQLAESVMNSSIKWINNFLPRIKHGFSFKLRKYFQFAFYSLLEGMGLIRSLKAINRLKDRLIILFLYPIAFFVYVGLKINKKL